MLDFQKAVSEVHRRARCISCKKRYHPHPRLGSRQKTCGSVECHRKHRARYQCCYRRSDPEAQKDIKEKLKNSRTPDFWKTYRLKHLASTERNRKLTKLRMRLKRAGLQRKLDILEVLDPKGVFDRFHEFATSHRLMIEEIGFTPRLDQKGA